MGMGALPLVVTLATACGDDNDDGDLAAFCAAADRIEAAEPLAVADDRARYDAELDEMEAAMADARANAPAEISGEVEAAAGEMEAVIAALRALEDPTDDAEVEAALTALDDRATGVTGSSELDVYLVEHCDPAVNS